MIYEGKAITVKALESGIVELKFDLKGESVNKFNRLTLEELRQAVDAIKADAAIKGVIVSSGKDVFIVGADITEFVDNFKLPEAELVAGNRKPIASSTTLKTSPCRPSLPSTASPWVAAWKCAWRPITASCPRARRSVCPKSSWASTQASVAPCACRA